MKPGESFVLGVHTNVRQGSGGRIHLPAPVQLLPFLQGAPSLHLLARAAVHVGLYRPDPGRIVNAAPFLNIGQRIREHSFFYIREDQKVGTGEVWLHVKDGAKLFDTSLTLDNTIIANNGASECFVRGSVTSAGAGNLIVNNGSGVPFSACPDVVTSNDPQLGALQLNAPGNTPTMAIPQTSPAFNTADAATSLSTDQRGVSRPQGTRFDIGAYEVCVSRVVLQCFPGIIAPPPQFEPLTTQASPAAGGTVSPPSGIFPFNSVVVLNATANNGYSFVNWTPNVAVPSNPSTTVTMDQPQTVTASFAPLPTSIFGNIVAKSGPANNRDWTLSLLNNGPGGAFTAMIPSFTLMQTFGAACTPVVTNAASFPLLVGDLAPLQTGTANVMLDFTGCAATARFTATFTYSASNGAVSGSVVRFNQFQ